MGHISNAPKCLDPILREVNNFSPRKSLNVYSRAKYYYFKEAFRPNSPTFLVFTKYKGSKLQFLLNVGFNFSPTH